MTAGSKSTPIAPRVPRWLAEFHDEGFAVLPGFFTGAECDAISAACSARVFPVISPDLARWVLDPRWADVAIPALGPHVRFFREQLVTKANYGNNVVPWHQDHAYAPTEPAGFITCFLALDAVTAGNGCLWVVPGSHHYGPLAHTGAGRVLTLAIRPPTDGVPVELAKGDLLVLSSLTLHRSGANHSSGLRPAWIVQFIPAAATDARTGLPYDDRRVVADWGEWFTGA